MTHTPSKSRQPAPSPAAQPCPKSLAGAFNKQPLENDTPDATGGCAANGPQTQQRCGFALTTTFCAANHAARTPTLIN